MPKRKRVEDETSTEVPNVEQEEKGNVDNFVEKEETNREPTSQEEKKHDEDNLNENDLSVQELFATKCNTDHVDDLVIIPHEPTTSSLEENLSEEEFAKRVIQKFCDLTAQLIEMVEERQKELENEEKDANNANKENETSKSDEKEKCEEEDLSKETKIEEKVVKEEKETETEDNFKKHDSKNVEE